MSNIKAIKVNYRPKNSSGYVTRLNIFYFFIVLLFSILIFRLFIIQVLQGKRYESMAINNKQQTIRIPAYRGEIYLNKQNKKIAKNNMAFSLFIVPNSFPSYRKERQLWEEMVNKVSEDFGVPTNRIISILRRGKVNPYKSYLLEQNLEFAQVVKLAENLESYPGLVYQQVPLREYVEGEKYAHIVGYIKKINERELLQKRELGYFRDCLIGVDGVEAEYDLEMKGKDGRIIQIVDVKNRVKEEIIPPDGDSIPGNDIFLTIDERIQNIVYDMMQGYPGGCIVTRPATGEILALYSYPSYDPNIFIGKVDKDKFDYYNTNTKKPFLNRVIKGLYPPSSIFKIITSLAALKDDEISFYGDRCYCVSGFQVGPEFKKCEGAHKNQNMHQALVNSCNAYFYKIGIDIGSEKIIRYASKYFKMGELTGIDLPYEKVGRVPTHRWKSEQYGTYWWDGDTANLSIGQGFLLTTVVQLNTLIGAIANNGVTYEPYLLESVRESQTKKIIFKNKKKAFIELPVEKRSLNRLKKSLREVAVWGTARNACKSKIKIAGKTGTAQNVQGAAHAWFSCYAPYNAKKPENKIAVTVFIEHGKSGGGAAAPFATAIIEAIFKGGNVKTIYKRLLQPWEAKSYAYEEWLKKRNEKPLTEEYLEFLLEKGEG